MYYNQMTLSLVSGVGGRISRMTDRKIRRPRYLCRGMVSRAKFDILISLTSISSEPIIYALKDYLVMNFELNQAAFLNSVKQSNVSRALEVLDMVAEKVEKINELESISVY